MWSCDVNVQDFLESSRQTFIFRVLAKDCWDHMIQSVNSHFPFLSPHADTAAFRNTCIDRFCL